MSGNPGFTHGAMQNARVADGDAINRLEHERLWDRDGAEWQTKWSRWASAKQVSGFVGRDQAIAISVSPGQAPRWLVGAEASEWWAHAKHHFEVPGQSTAKADASGQTWGAHIYRRDQLRLLVVETFC